MKKLCCLLNRKQEIDILKDVRKEVRGEGTQITYEIT